MNKIAELIVNHKKIIIIFFIIITLASSLLIPLVKVNYDMTDYLPPSAQSTKALDIMTSEFTESMPNASVMVKNISIIEALEYKSRLAGIEGVSQVIWLDDMIDIKQPLEAADKKTVEGFYKNNNALFSVTIIKNSEKLTTAKIIEMIGETNSITGDAPDIANMQNTTGSTVMSAMFILVPIIIFLLVITSVSWLEPLLFLLTIGVSILINMGSNVLFESVSFMTFAVSPILQLACSLDYSVFLLHNFNANRKKYDDVNTAMKQSIIESMSTVAASASTTLFGFLALVFMNFQIGSDLGINLAKGIILSFISAIVFMPAMTLLLYKKLDKTKHREFLPSFHNIYKVISKLNIPAMIFVVIIIIPCFLGQQQSEFMYGNELNDPDQRAYIDKKAIKDEFGTNTVMVLLVPKGDVAKEEALYTELKNIDHVTNIMAYTNTVGKVIPPEYLEENISDRFYSKNYARIIIYTNTANEGDLAFETVETIQKTAEKYYDSDVYSVGQSTNLFDMKNLVKIDNIMVNTVAIITIFLTLLITFKSLTLPFFLLLTIETGIWINLSLPYFTNTTINFIGYLVLSTVQLGATVDYAILLTTHYLRNRQQMGKKESISKTIGDTFKSILVSAVTLSTAGFTLALTSSNMAIKDIGMLLCRGTILSLLMVVIFLPGVLVLFDKLIYKTTYKANFLMKKKQHDDKK